LRGVLVVGGIVHGAYASGGVALVVYAQQALRRKEAFRGTLVAMWLVLNIVLVAMKLGGGEWNADTGWLVLIGVPLVVVGSWLGELAARRLDQQRFARFVAALLILAGTVTIGRQVL
jgi:hypothetical protein